jgi:hypothetical protein
VQEKIFRFSSPPRRMWEYHCPVVVGAATRLPALIAREWISKRSRQVELHLAPSRNVMRSNLPCDKRAKMRQRDVSESKFIR